MNPDAEDPQSLSQPSTPASLPVLLANIYAAPGEVFDSLRESPARWPNWLVPAVLAAVVGVISVWVMFSQPAIVQQIEDAQNQRYEQLVADGKMTQEQVDQMQRSMGGLQLTIARIAGTVGALVGTFGWLFILATVCFLVMRLVFRRPLPYMKTVEIVGLSLMIGVLGGLVTTLLMVITGSMFANLGPVLFIGEFDAKNKLHLIASSVNVFTLWWLGVLALGLSRVSQIAFVKPALLFYGLWAVLRLLIIFSGLGSGGM